MLGRIKAFHTFPGIVMHELVQQICCWLCRMPVFKVNYFHLDDLEGYVRYERSNNPWKNLIVSMAPFFINTGLGMLITLPAYTNIFGFRYMRSMYDFFVFLCSLILYWIGLSVLMHAFPSIEDAEVLAECILKNKEVKIFAKILAAPCVGFIYIGEIGGMFWLDLVYGILMSLVLPKLTGILVF